MRGELTQPGSAMIPMEPSEVSKPLDHVVGGLQPYRELTRRLDLQVLREQKIRDPKSVYEATKNAPVIQIIGGKSNPTVVGETIKALVLPTMEEARQKGKQTNVYAMDLSGIGINNILTQGAAQRGFTVGKQEFSPSQVISGHTNDIAAAVLVEGMHIDDESRRAEMTDEIETLFDELQRDATTRPSLQRLDTAISFMNGRQPVDESPEYAVTDEEFDRIRLRYQRAGGVLEKKMGLLAAAQVYIRALIKSDANQDMATNAEKGSGVQFASYSITEDGTNNTTPKKGLASADVLKRLQSTQFRPRPDILVITGVKDHATVEMIRELEELCNPVEGRAPTQLIVHFGDMKEGALKDIGGNSTVITLGDLRGDAVPLADNFGRKKDEKITTTSGDYRRTRNEESTHRVSPDTLNYVAPYRATVITTDGIYTNLHIFAPPGAMDYVEPGYQIAQHAEPGRIALPSGANDYTMGGDVFDGSDGEQLITDRLWQSGRNVLGRITRRRRSSETTDDDMRALPSPADDIPEGYR